MKIKTARFPNNELLETYLQKVKSILLNQEYVVWFRYPKALNKTKSWDNHVSEIKQLNESILNEISSSAGVYAIFVRSSIKDRWELKYIGQTAKKYSRARITNHLITKHKRTGAKLDSVTKSVMVGNQIGLSFVRIEPPGLRHYIEERLISSHKELEWNQHKREAL
jgi:hypothetical protein